MSAMQPEIADDPRQVRFLDDMLRIGGPETLRVKFLERQAREFEAALTSFRNLVSHVHGAEFSPSADCEQAASSQPQLLEPVVHFFEMEVERAEGFKFALLEMFCHDPAGLSFPQCTAMRL